MKLFNPKCVTIILVASCLVTLAFSEGRQVEEPVATPIPVVPDIPSAALSGDRITLNVEQVDIRAMLTLFSQSRRVSIVAGPEVEGTISVNLFDVPFEEALRSILGVAGFTHYTKGKVIYVTTEEAKKDMPLASNDLEVRTYHIHHADPAMIVRSLKTFLSPSGKAIINSDDAGGESSGSSASSASSSPSSATGETLLIVQDAPAYLLQIDALIPQLDVPPYEAVVFEIEHSDIETLRTAVEDALSPRGSVQVATDKRMVVRDAPEYLERVRVLIGELDVVPRQVLISTRILNINYDSNMAIGMNFGSSSIPYDPIRFDSNLPFLTNPGQDVTSITTGEQGVFSMILRDHEQLYIDALESRGHVETLAAPELLALEGEEASMIIGQKLGYKTNAQADNNTTFENVQFVEVGTQIKVTPEITRDGLIRMKIAPKVSDGEINEVSGVPDENTTEVETTTIVRDGETILIGGLINARKQRSRSGLPVLGRIPVVGLLFGRKRAIDSKSELVILITPHIVGNEGTPGMTDQADRIKNVEEQLFSRESSPKTILQPDRPQIIQPLQIAPTVSP